MKRLFGTTRHRTEASSPPRRRVAQRKRRENRRRECEPSASRAPLLSLRHLCEALRLRGKLMSHYNEAVNQAWLPILTYITSGIPGKGRSKAAAILFVAICLCLFPPALRAQNLPELPNVVFENFEPEIREQMRKAYVGA